MEKLSDFFVKPSSFFENVRKYTNIIFFINVVVYITIPNTSMLDRTAKLGTGKRVSTRDIIRCIFE